MLQFSELEFWNEEELFALQVQAVSRFMKVDTPHAVEATLEFARFLNRKGLDSENYPLFLEILRNENRYVVDALIGTENAFNLFTRVQPNSYIIDTSLQVLRAYTPGAVHEKTLELIFGILYRNYHSAREGHALRPLTIEDVNAIGKFLDKEKDQSDPLNRFILDILADIAEYRSINNEDAAVDANASHATAIRNAFFDRRRAMTSVMPAEILVRKNYESTLVKPRKARAVTQPARKAK